MIGAAIDNAIGVAFPGWAARRTEARLYRNSLKVMASGVHRGLQQLQGGKQGGYEAGKNDRLKGRGFGSPHENDVPYEQIERLRWRAWNLHRNCPQARKITRTLKAKVIGAGLSPHPQATNDDGTPFVEFRQQARIEWAEFIKESDWRGKPGLGGQNFTTQSKTAFQNTMLSGGVLYRFHHLDAKEQKQRELYLPLQLQTLHITRLDSNKHDGKRFFRGIELDESGRIKDLWVILGGDSDVKVSGVDSVPVPISEMRYVISEEDIDQLIGSSWFGAALLTMDDRRNYEYSELVAAEMAACFVALYRRSAGQRRLGLGGKHEGDRDLTDEFGNPITRLQAGMIIDGGETGDLQFPNPGRPNSGAAEFLNHLLRGEAVSMPGIKSSTLTGDYRNSSFSSERSADNDVWPEVEDMQGWWSGSFNQPVYEEVITAGVLAGHFDHITAFSVEDFKERRRAYMATQWQGPVLRSINPKDDAAASQLRVRNLQSTPQLEASMLGRDWRENVNAIKEFITYCRGQELPDDIIYQALGIEQTDATAAGAAPAETDDSPTEQEQDDATAHSRQIAASFSIMNRA